MIDAPTAGPQPVAALSVVIPAHDEQDTIRRCLTALLRDTEPGEFEVVVVPNGCSDDTAAAARRAAPAARVVELSAPSKTAALRAGDAAATVFPRFYLDADIEVEAATLRAAARLLDEGALATSAAPEFVLDARPLLIRLFYRTWSQLPYLSTDAIGNGLYGLSAHGRARFAEFPDVTADDLFVQGLFDAAERRTVPDRTFRIHTPRTLKGLLAVRTRAYRGNRELDQRGLRGSMTRDNASGGGRALVAHLVRHPRRVPAAVPYVLVNVVAQRRARRADRSPPGLWERDDSSRRPEPVAKVQSTAGQETTIRRAE